MFDFFSSPQTQIEKGRDAVAYFHNQSARYATYPYTLDEAIDLIAGGPAKAQNFLEGLGLAIESVESGGFLWDSKVKTAMETLADRSQGKLPTMQSFFSALNSSAQDISYVQLAGEVSKGVAADTVTAAVEVGKTVKATAQTLNQFLPIVVVAAALYIVAMKTKQVAGK